MATVPGISAPAAPPVRAGREFLDGVKLLGRGFGMYTRSPRLLLLGTIPAVISLLVVLTGVGALVYFLPDLSALVTWFADDWSSAARTAARVVAGAAIMTIAVLLVVVSFTALTLIIGDPFYEVISARVEAAIGGAPTEPDAPFLVTLRRNLVDSVRLLLLSLSVGVPLFLAGFIPVLGQSVVPVIDVVFGGWLLAVELTGVPCNRRGLRLADRRRLLRANRALALGFGVPVFLVILLVPFAAIVVIPAAVAGATLLTRRLVGLPVA